MNKLPKFVTASFTFVAWMVLPSCTSRINSDMDLQQEFSEVQKRTLPPGARLINQRAIALEGLGASEGWEFETNYTPDAFKSWVTGRLQPDFQVRETAASRLRFSKNAHGDVETLTMEMVPSSGGVHLTVHLEIYAD